MKPIHWRTILPLMLIALVFALPARGGETYDFRKTRWGMSQAEVMASETLELKERTKDVLGYETQLFGKDVMLVYAFVKDRLVRARYFLSERHANKLLYIKDYEQFTEALEKKYGPPTLDEIDWLNPLFKDKPSHWGTAVSVGHMKMSKGWDASTTLIVAMLVGDNYKISCFIDYNSKELHHLENEAVQQKELEKF